MLIPQFLLSVTFVFLWQFSTNFYLYHIALYWDFHRSVIEWVQICTRPQVQSPGMNKTIVRETGYHTRGKKLVFLWELLRNSQNLYYCQMMFIRLRWLWDPWVAQRFGACLWPRARSWRPRIESHVRLPGSNPTSGSRCMEPASPSSCVSALSHLSLCDYHK